MNSLKMSQKNVTIVADIKKSRIKADDENAEKLLRAVLTDVNEKYAEDLLIPFTIIFDGIFQCVLRDASKTISIITDVEWRTYPFYTRFGIGIGEAGSIQESVGIAGSGYTAALEALYAIRESEHRHREPHLQHMVSICDDETKDRENMLNTILMLTAAIKSTWNRRKFNIFFDMLINRQTQIDTAKRLDLNQSSVQKSLTSGTFNAYNTAMRFVENALSSIQSEQQ